MTTEKKLPELNLTIDRLRLEEEWVRQPNQYHNWAVLAADAQAEYDTAKSRLEVVKAELYRDIRDDPDGYDLTKVTEVALNNTIPLQPEFQMAVKRVNEAKHDLEVVKAAVDALEHKKRALTMLVELWTKEYYSEIVPRIGNDNVSDFDKRAIRQRARRRREEQEDDRDGREG